MKLLKSTYSLAAGLCLLLTGCSEYTPTGYTEAPELPKASALAFTVGGEANHQVDLSWIIPADNDVTGCILYRDAQEIQNFALSADRTYTYTALGTALGEGVVYTVKVKYADNSLSAGTSVVVNLPAETLEGVKDLKYTRKGRNITLEWDLPSQAFRTGIRIITNGDSDKAILLPADATSYVLRSQPMEVDLTYDVEVVYDTYYYSPAQSIEENIPYVEPKLLFLLPSDAATYNDLPDDDELAAATWFAKQPNTYFIHPADIPDYDPADYTCMWIMVDRVGLQLGWENLPGDLASESTIAALKAYSAEGGNLYLSTMATQLTVPLGFVPDNMAPTVYGNGGGGSGDDIWTINPYLGWMFKDGADQGFYDRTDHAIFKDLKLEELNGYPYASLPLIGPGQREDHNCLWDCNIYGRGQYPDVIANFEATTGSLVLATWGHVRDHCVAGLVDFYATAEHGRCVAMGLAAYEWNQNSGMNPYQGNVEKLTENILNYLK